MKTITLSVLFTLFTICTFASKLYVKTFGNKNNTAILFLHGGPGYNCVTFESTTAQALSDKGFFVIVYDRRGEGRSVDANAKYNFAESIKDINLIFETQKIKKAIFLGHSFGGILATKFAEANPEKVDRIILVGAPIALQETFTTIINTCKNNYIKNNDSTSLGYISMLQEMDINSLEYSSYTFMHAMQNKLYSPKIYSDEAKTIYKKMKTDSVAKLFASKMTIEAPTGFWTNEKYTNMNIADNIKKLIANKIQIFGLYGKDDGLYSPLQIASLQNIVGENNIKYIDNASHSVFIDQQTLFIESILNWSKQ
jgi:proline iminopeptidase